MSNKPLHKQLGFKDGDFVSVAFVGYKPGPSDAETIPATKLDDYVADKPEGDRWIGAQPVREALKGGRAKAEDVTALRVLYADLDGGGKNAMPDLYEFVDHMSAKLGQEPISVVSSGSGLHPRWKVKNGPTDPAEIKAALDGWKALIQGEAKQLGIKMDSVFDAPRVLRLPGTTNHKPEYGDDGKPVTLTEGSGKALSFSALPFDTQPAQEAPEGASGAPGTEPAINALLAKKELKRNLKAEVRTELAKLDALRAGGDHWRQTQLEMTSKLAKIANTPRSPYDVASMRELYLKHAAYDDGEVDLKEVTKLWDSAVKKQKGIAFEVHVDLDSTEGAKALDGGDGKPAKKGKKKAQKAEEAQKLGAVDTLRSKIIDAETMKALPRPKPLVPGFISEGSFARIFGGPKQGKTFVALDMMLRLAHGMEWAGRGLKARKVLYLIAEGQGDFPKRLEAWEKHTGQTIDPKQFQILPEPVQTVDNETEWSALCQIATEDRFDVVVLDTQARVTVGMEENSNSEMGRFNDSVDKLRRESGAAVVIVHHTGIQAKDRSRGANTVAGAVDTELGVTYEGEYNVLRTHLQKSMGEAPDVCFTRKIYTLGVEDDETVIDSVALEYVANGAETIAENNRQWDNRILDNMVIFVAKDVAHTRKQLRVACNIGATKSREYVDRLIEMGRLRETGTGTNKARLYVVSEDDLDASFEADEEGSE